MNEELNWEEATPEVLHIAEQLIEQYHPHLKSVNICFVFRSEAQKSKGRMVLGNVSRVPERLRLFMDQEYQFVIWLSREDYERMTTAERTAMIDHELCHIHLNKSGGFSIVGHDFEEFYSVIQRHGLWDQRLQRAERELTAYQMSLGIAPSGIVGTVRMTDHQAEADKLLSQFLDQKSEDDEEE